MTRRLFTQRVKSGSRNQTVLQRINQSRIIDQRAARGVNQQRTPLHRLKLIGSDQVAGLVWR